MQLVALILIDAHIRNVGWKYLMAALHNGKNLGGKLWTFHVGSPPSDG